MRALLTLVPRVRATRRSWRWSVAALVLAGCAGRDTMPWPAPPPEPEVAYARGGPVVAPAVVTLAPEVVREELPTELDAPPRAPTRLVFMWPIPATGINSLFGTRADPFERTQRFHAGLDLAGVYGELVRASAPGLVVGAGWAAGHGRSVSIEHAGGFRTVYSHLSQVFVMEGAEVDAGTVIGRLGNSGRSTGPHLHFELSRYGQPLDPLDLLGDSVSVR